MDEVMSAPAYYDVPPGRTIVKSSMEVPAKPDISFAWQNFMPSRVVFELKKTNLEEKKSRQKRERDEKRGRDKISSTAAAEAMSSSKGPAEEEDVP
jgi:hypothetical protein